MLLQHGQSSARSAPLLGRQRRCEADVRVCARYGGWAPVGHAQTRRRFQWIRADLLPVASCASVQLTLLQCRRRRSVLLRLTSREFRPSLDAHPSVCFTPLCQDGAAEDCYAAPRRPARCCLAWSARALWPALDLACRCRGATAPRSRPRQHRLPALKSCRLTTGPLWYATSGPSCSRPPSAAG